MVGQPFFSSKAAHATLPQIKGKICGEQRAFQHCPYSRSLNRLEIRSSLKSIPDLQELHCLTKLAIFNCSRLTRLPEGLECLTRLNTLEIGGFDEMDAFPSLSSILHLHASLEKLDLFGWDKLNSLPEEIQYFTALKGLEIFYFERLEALPEWLGNLSSLQYLYVHYCPKLKERYEGNSERSNIAHIPRCYTSFVQELGGMYISI